MKKCSEFIEKTCHFSEDHLPPFKNSNSIDLMHDEVNGPDTQIAKMSQSQQPRIHSRWQNLFPKWEITISSLNA